MKKGLIIGLIGIIVVLAAGLTIPAVAHGPGLGDNSTAPNQDGWESMRNACLSGDWDSMNEAAREFHNENYNYGSCPAARWDNSTENELDMTQSGKRVDWWNQMDSFMDGSMMNGRGGHMG